MAQENEKTEKVTKRRLLPCLQWKGLLCNDEEGENCSKLPEDGKTTHEIALARCECLMDRYLRWKKKDHKKSDRAQRAALIFTAITPVLLLIPWNYVNLLGAAASAVATIATGLLAISGWRESYIRYGYMWHTLQVEKYRYLTRATEEYSDSDKEKAARNFASRIEQLVMTEVNDWRVEMQRVEQQNRLRIEDAAEQVRAADRLESGRS